MRVSEQEVGCGLSAQVLLQARKRHAHMAEKRSVAGTAGDASRHGASTPDTETGRRALVAPDSPMPCYCRNKWLTRQRDQFQPREFSAMTGAEILRRADAVPLGAVAALAASTARRHSTVPSAVHPSRSTARHGSVSHFARSRHRAGAPMRHSLGPVSTSNEEHGCTIGQRSRDNTESNESAGRVHLAARATVAAERTAIPSSLGGWIEWCGHEIGGSVAHRLASLNRTGCIDEVGKLVHNRIVVVIKGVEWIFDARLERGFKILGDREESKRGKKARSRDRVKVLESVVDNLALINIERFGNRLWQIGEDLIAAVVVCDEAIVQRVFEADLSHEAVCWYFGGNAIRRRDQLGQG